MSLQNIITKGKILVILLALAAVQTKALNITFSINMYYQIQAGLFNTSTDKVYLRGTFNNWDLSTPMHHNGNGVYSVTLEMQVNAWCEYKYYTDAPGFPNNGFELNVGASRDNRSMNIGENSLVLETMYFNNANMILRETNDYFNLYCADSDLNILDDVSKTLNKNFKRIVDALETFPKNKVNIWIYPSSKAYHLAYGYPDAPSWAVGSAFGGTDVLLVTPNIGGELEGYLGVAIHEFTHIAVAWKTITGVPSWLNEGAATFLADEVLGPRNLKNMITQFGRIPVLADFYTDSFWGDYGGYGFAYSIADFIIMTKGLHAFVQFIERLDYSVIGYSSENEFQTAWQKYLTDYHITEPVYVQYQIDMNNYISMGKFNPETDRVYVSGPFGSWYPYALTSEIYGVYSTSIPSLANTQYQYKFKINTEGADNNGWEENVGSGENGCRVLTTGSTNLVVPITTFNNYVAQKKLSITAEQFPSKVYANQEVEIKWTAQNVNRINISLSQNNGAGWGNIETNVDASAGKYKWKVPAFHSGDCLIQIVDASNPAIVSTSSSKFAIVSLELSAPIGGENWMVASVHSIEWNSYVTDNLKILYSTNNGTKWNVIADNVDASLKKYDWTIPNALSKDCLVAVQLKSTLAYIKSPAVFTISDPADVESENIPTEFSLKQNYPNPFNPVTTIKYAIPITGTYSISLLVYDALGREVARLVDEEKQPGNYEVQFDGRNLTSGVYFCILRAGNYIGMKKLLLLK